MINNGFYRVVDGMKSYGKWNASVGGTSLRSGTNFRKAFCIVLSTIAAGYCRLIESRFSTHLLEKSVSSMQGYLSVETVKMK